MKKRIICCGESLFDVLYQKKNSNNISFNAFPGGSVTNTSAILASLGMNVSLISRLGNDFLSTYLIDLLNKKGIDTKYIIRDSKKICPIAMANIDRKGNSSYIFYDNMPKRSRKRGSNKNEATISLKNTSLFHTGSFFSYSDNYFDMVHKLLKQARSNKTFITYDPNWRENKIDNKKKVRTRIEKILSYVNLLKLSEEDARSMTGAGNLSEALKLIESQFNGCIIVTLGPGGSLFKYGKEELFQPAFKVKIADTIGAGDSFTAGIIAAFIMDGRKSFRKNMQTNLRFASAVSALVCSTPGATNGLKSLPQVQNFLKSHPTKTQ